MGALMQEYDWNSHPLGNPADWPQSLQTGIQMILQSRFPMFIWWSDQLYMFHNDAYLPALGKKHPKALGASARVMWAEIWDQIGAVAENILKESTPFYAEDLLILLDRKGFLEETYWTFSYSPMPANDGSTGGMFCACSEVTGKIIGERRLKAIKEIARVTAPSHSLAQACQQTCELLTSNSSDVAFSLIYLLDGEGTSAELYGHSGNLPAAAMPQNIDLALVQEKDWPLQAVQQDGQHVLVEDLKGKFAHLANGTWPDAVERAVVLPIPKPGENQLYGFIVLGVSFRLEYDLAYQEFHKLIADQVSSNIFQVQSRQEIEVRERELRQMANSIPHLVLTFTTTGGVDYGNQQWYEYTGHTEEETLGWKWSRAIHPDERGQVREAGQYSLQTGKGIELDFRLRRADGLYRWHRIHAIPGQGEEGSINKWYGTITDIHDHRLAEDELLQSKIQEQSAHAEAELQRARLERLFMQAPAAISILAGPDMVFEFINPGYQQLFPGRHLLGKPVLEALPEILDQPIYTILKNVYETGETFHGKEIKVQLARYENALLEKLYFNFIYQARLNQQGEVDGVVVFAHEVTDLVEARKNVERSEEHLRMALDAGNMATFDLNMVTQQTIRSANHDELFGYASELSEWNMEVLLKHLLPEDRPMVSKQYEHSLETGRLFLSFRIKHVNGQFRWIEGHGKVFYVREGQPDRIVGVMTDVTERKMAEQQLQALTQELAKANTDIQARNKELALSNEQLKRINADLDNFVYTASHDLRSPINSMEGLILVLQDQLEGKLAEEDYVLFEHLNNSMVKLNRTIKDLSEIVKAQKDTDLPLEAILVQEVLEDVQTDILAEGVGHQVAFEYDLQVPSLIFPRKHLRSVLYNLLSNAIKYQHPDRPPRIKVRTMQQEQHVQLSVADNGLGLNPRQLKKLFGMFQRMHPHTEGNGIGLYTIKRVIENYGGKITAESSEGAGSTFHVYIPGTPIHYAPD
ncbi:hypothetical protein GCM10027443_35490 [Pontibacter brevis]